MPSRSTSLLLVVSLAGCACEGAPLAPDGGGPEPIDFGEYPVEVVHGRCEPLWHRWGPTDDAASGVSLRARGTDAWFVERDGERSFLVHVDGLDGAVLQRDPIGSADEQVSLAAGADVDGDGLAEIVVTGATLSPSGDDAGAVSSGTEVDTRIAPLSGRSSEPLWTRARTLMQLVGCCGAAWVRDRDGDGAPDLVVSDSGAPRPPLTVLSGRTGAELGSLPLPDATEIFGDRIVGAGDASGDGIDDLFVTDGFGPSDRFGQGAVYAIDGASGAVRWRVIGGTEGGDPWLLGGAEIAAADIDGDGVSDLVASAHNAAVGEWGEAGRVLAYSGVDGSPLWIATGSRPYDHLGLSVSATDDVDGDGSRDVLAGAEGVSNVTSSNGRAVVLRGRDGTVLIEVRSLAVRPCVNPAVPDPRCQPDLFGTARALEGAGGDGIVVLFATPAAIDPDGDRRGIVAAMRCTP